ncbi:MAG TPA: hypothetical protein VMG13_18865, partial [Trebonia sp.]|nr:hypothetical protein [Trebonia sp.]
MYEPSAFWNTSDVAVVPEATCVLVAGLKPWNTERLVYVPWGDPAGPCAVHCGNCPRPVPGACPIACFTFRVTENGTMCG